MAAQPNIQSILDALKGKHCIKSRHDQLAHVDQYLMPCVAAQQTPASTGSFPHPGGPAPSNPSYPGPPPGSYAQGPPPPGHAPPYGSQLAYPSHMPTGYPYPTPTGTGTIDLSGIRPVNSGTVSLEQAIAQAKSYAAEQGVTPYDRQVAPERGYRRSRSRSPGRRDAHRDNYNPYRDERRADHGMQHGHEYQRERSYSPGPRAHSNFPPAQRRDRSPGRGKDDNSETMEIDSSLVGLIIGRAGENLRRVEGETQCRVQFIPDNGQNDGFRLCKIIGPAPRRAEARAAINKIIQDSGLGNSNRTGMKAGRDSNHGASSQGGAAVAQEGEATLKIMVPDRTVGLIIGRGGETIRDLQERSLCHINIVSENKSINGFRPVNLIGSPEAARMAKDLIMEIVDSDSRNSNNQAAQPQGVGRPGRNEHNPRDNGPGNDKVTDVMFVPSEAVGMIIGKGGETIREMQNSTGCKINVSQVGDVEREIGLVGSLDAIERAKQSIQEKVDAVVCQGPDLLMTITYG
jgi:far upstream element-binding protein